MDIDSYTKAPDTIQLSYSFLNIDINAASCKYISGLAPLDANDMPIISTNSMTGIQNNPGPNTFIGLHIANYLPPTPNNTLYPAAKNSYRCSDLYIYNYKSDNKTQLVHKVKQVPGALGEIVIKHKPNVLTDPTLYICFFLVASANTSISAQPNDVDKILEFATTQQSSAAVMTSGLSNCIPTQTLGMQFTDPKGNVVIILSDPIKINTASQKILASFNASIVNQLPTISLPSWLVQNPTNAFKLGASNITIGDTDNVYMECIPTGISKEDIKAYTVPINSQYTEDASKIEFMSSTIRFTFLVFFVLILYALFPTFWSTIYKIINPSEKADDETPEMRLELDAVEFWYYVFLFCIFAVTFSLGLAFNFDSTHISIAFLIIFTLALTSTMILFNRTAKDPKHFLFKETFKEGFPEINNYFSSLAPVSDDPNVNPWIDTLKFWKRPGLWAWLFFVLTIAVNLIIIVIQHKGKIPTSINSDTTNISTDPNVMNVIELLDCIFGSIFALIAIRVVYKIYIKLQETRAAVPT